ncbi:MAG: hypothetical protein AB7I59_26155 [Geminicoccaceae bacterium]
MAPLGLLAHERTMQVSGEDRLHNQERLRELARAHGSEVGILCSHDPGQLDAPRATREACTGDAHRLSSAA